MKKIIIVLMVMFSLVACSTDDIEPIVEVIPDDEVIVVPDDEVNGIPCHTWKINYQEGDFDITQTLIFDINYTVSYEIKTINLVNGDIDISLDNYIYSYDEVVGGGIIFMSSSSYFKVQEDINGVPGFTLVLGSGPFFFLNQC